MSPVYGKKKERKSEEIPNASVWEAKTAVVRRAGVCVCVCVRFTISYFQDLR